jgi:YegS/Rv2252/BmrU family lipid kinase
MKTLFIYNPCAGKRKTLKNLDELLDIFHEASWDVLAHPTTGPGDGADFLLRSAKDCERVICAGGDGTLREISGALAEAGLLLPLGYIPAGSTNDFGRSLGLPGDLPACARRITKGSAIPVDSGTACGKHFIYIMAFGIFTGITYQTPQKLKNFLGHGAYVLWALRELFSLRSERLTARWTEGDEERSVAGEFLLGMVSNSRSAGGFWGITGKDVDLGDGLLELTLVRRPKGIRDWWNLISFARDKEIPDERILRRKSARIRLDFERPVPVSLDGEEGGAFQSLEIQCKKHSLSFLC